MTYFDFLGLFLLIPIGLLLAVAFWDRARGREIPLAMRAWPPAAAILLHAVIALLYTTIWDNYLVATRVWWYDPALVTGLTIAYVPIEEYTFFILQPILAGLWLIFLFKRVRLPERQICPREAAVLGSGGDGRLLAGVAASFSQRLAAGYLYGPGIGLGAAADCPAACFWRGYSLAVPAVGPPGHRAYDPLPQRG